MCMSTWIVDKDRMKHHSRTKNNFRAIWQWKTSQMLTTTIVIRTDYATTNRLGRFWIAKFRKVCMQSDTLLLPDIFKNVLNKRIEIYKLDPKYYLSASGLAWQDVWRKQKQNWDCWRWHASNRRKGNPVQNVSRDSSISKSQQLAHKRLWPNTESSYLMYWNLNNLYGWAMSQKLSVDVFKWRIEKFTFDEGFIQDYDK